MRQQSADLHIWAGSPGTADAPVHMVWPCADQSAADGEFAASQTVPAHVAPPGTGPASPVPFQHLGTSEVISEVILANPAASYAPCAWFMPKP